MRWRHRRITLEYGVPGGTPSGKVIPLNLERSRRGRRQEDERPAWGREREGFCPAGPSAVLATRNRLRAGLLPPTSCPGVGRHRGPGGLGGDACQRAEGKHDGGRASVSRLYDSGHHQQCRAHGAPVFLQAGGMAVTSELCPAPSPRRHLSEEESGRIPPPLPFR